MKISVIGLGKLGLPLAASIASKGFEVFGVDINKEVVVNLNKGKTLLQEPGLKDLIKKNRDRIQATDKLKNAVISSDLTFIITPTPSKSNGYFSLRFVKKAIKDIARILKSKNKYHLVVIVSTLMPGSTDEIKKLLEKYSGKICGKDFGLCYNPEFIALGSVIYNLLNPDFILIGELDKKAGDILQKFYKRFCNNKPKFAVMSFVNAELTKISVNTYITTKISYANMLSEICEKLPGGDIDAVTSALGLDTRIGAKYLKGGPAFGGPCFPRDNVAFISLARNLKTSYDISLATHKTNLKQVERLAKKVLQFASKNSTVGILGLAYKPFTDVVEKSTGLHLAKLFLKLGISLNLYDPLALKNAQKELGNGAGYMKSLRDTIATSDILVIATNWPEFRKINKSWLGKRPKVLIDPWRIINTQNLTKNVTYLPLGLNL